MSSRAKNATPYCPEGENHEGWEATLQQETGLDDIDTPVTLTVYLLKPEGLWKHHSLLFYMEKKFFIIHLLKFPDEQGKEYATSVFIKSFDWDAPEHSHLLASELGTTNTSIRDLFEKAQGVLAAMGRYNAILNNCQDYCSKLAESLGCGSYCTDVDKVAAFSFVAVASIGLGLGLAAAAMSDKESKKQ